MNTRFARLSGAGPRLGNGAGNGPGSRAPQKRLGAVVGTGEFRQVAEACQNGAMHRSDGSVEIAVVTSAHRHVALGSERAAHRSTWDATGKPSQASESAKRTSHHPQPSDPSESLQGHAGCLRVRARDRPERDCESAIGTNGDPGRLDRVGTVGLRLGQQCQEWQEDQEDQKCPDPLGRD